VVHPSWPGYAKIGKARRPAKRLSTYNTGDPLRRYALAWTIFTANYDQAERVAHKRLAGLRVGWTEWFQIHPEDAREILQSLTAEETVNDH
jgi:hypothetical protein